MTLAVIPEGWTLVPIHPTAAMVEAAVHCLDGVNVRKAGSPDSRRNATKKEFQTYKVCHRWWAMIAAAPSYLDVSPADAGQQYTDLGTNGVM